MRASIERDIAVKVLDRLATVFSEPDQERFRREARILARLSHPNIPAIYDVDFGPGRFSLVFQFVDGINLRQLIAKEGPCQISEARMWFHQIASALDYAHSLGIIHRDVKPDKTFSARLSGALRATKPLSEVLAHGKLHELAAALEELTAEDFLKLPAGQRALILTKVTDVVASGDTRLETASEQFLDLLLSIGLLLDK